MKIKTVLAVALAFSANAIVFVTPATDADESSVNLYCTDLIGTVARTFGEYTLRELVGDCLMARGVEEGTARDEAWGITDAILRRAFEKSRHRDGGD